MNWLKSLLLKALRGVIEENVQGALGKAVTELNEEIDARFTDEKQREALKSGIAMLRSRTSQAIRERL